MMGLWVLVGVTGYLLGTIPWGLVAGRLLKGVDVREYGSGRIGATNVLRALGVRAGVAVFVADMAKGAAAALMGWLLLGSELAMAVAALAAIAGHNWPAYLRLRGGRGVAPFFGGLAVFSLPIALTAGAVAAGLIALSRYVSLGSIIGAVAAAVITGLVLAWGRSGPEMFAYAVIGGAIILFQHRDNIQRLLAGRERKLGQPAERREAGKG